MQSVGVVGCGLMGAGIAEVCALAGLDVVISESDVQTAESGRARLERSLQHAEARARSTAPPTYSSGSGS